MPEQNHHGGYFGNFVEALAPYGIDSDAIPVAFNCLMNLSRDSETGALRTLPSNPEWPTPFVVKSRHGCNQIAFVRTGDENWPDIRSRAHRWLKSTYGVWLGEWLYGKIQKGVLVEPFIGCVDRLPIDYTFYVFGGHVEYIQVHLNREHAHRWILFDRSWPRVSSLTADPDPPAS